MYKTNGNQEQKWDVLIPVVHSIARISDDFEINIEPPKFRRNNSDGHVSIKFPKNFKAHGELTDFLAKLFILADEFELEDGIIWHFRIKEVYIWDENLHADDVDIEDL